LEWAESGMYGQTFVVSAKTNFLFIFYCTYIFSIKVQSCNPANAKNALSFEEVLQISMLGWQSELATHREEMLFPFGWQIWKNPYMGFDSRLCVVRRMSGFRTLCIWRSSDSFAIRLRNIDYVL
jgi:hypothetical protein